MSGLDLFCCIWVSYTPCWLTTFWIRQKMPLHTMKIKLFVSFLFSIYVSTLWAQTDSSDFNILWNWNKLSLTGMYQNRKVMVTNIFIKGSNANFTFIEDYQSFSLKLSLQTTGEHLWEHICNYPTWGCEVKCVGFLQQKRDRCADCCAWIYHAQIFRSNRLSLNYEFGFGVTFNWKSFNPLTNK